MDKELKNEYQLVVFKIGDEEFAVDISQVREIVRLIEVTCMPKAPDFIEGVVNLRGQIIAVINLSRRLGLPSQGRGNNTRIIVVEIGQCTVGMIVDSVSEVLRLSMQDIEEVPGIIETEVPDHYIRGVGKLRDRLLIFLDLNRILMHEEVVKIEKHLKTALKDK